MLEILKVYDRLVSVGLKPIALKPYTKEPIGKYWNEGWNPQRWRIEFEKDETCNMGILLGEVIDVEGDTQEANDLIDRMIGDFPHPKFQSYKSTHHLFISPTPDFRTRRFNGIEFRGVGSQSMIPPSIHPDHPSVRYRWLHDSKFPVPIMPDCLRQLYEANYKERSPLGVRIKPRLKPGYKKTNCRICGEDFFIHKKRLMLEVRAFREKGLFWMCHGCREFDMREPCRIIRKAIEKEARRAYAPLRDDD